LTTGAPISVSDEEELSVTGEEAQALPPCPPGKVLMQVFIFI
jgi:hypothetical protein